MDTEPRTIDGQLYWHFSQLKNWEKNNEARTISTANWLKLLADIKKNGVEDAFKIGSDGTVYDGNNRLKGVINLIANNVPVSENDKDLQWIPVTVKEFPTEADKWRAALTRNEQFASWNQEGLTNYLPEFETHLDLSLINISFGDPLSLDEKLDVLNIDEGKPPVAKAEKKEVTCPNCSHKFTP